MKMLAGNQAGQLKKSTAGTTFHYDNVSSYDYSRDILTNHSCNAVTSHDVMYWTCKFYIYFTFQVSFLLSNLKCSSIGAESRIHPRLVEICAYLGCQIFEIQPGRGLAPGLLCLLEAMIL